ncbi:hypothetical protein [Rhizobium leguminosarum]|uniref:hypothetical protein n=1 Tax=Rhizobium leguminosarum TaxID=384 RepID=UPI001441AE52|nr:hypothetical protein [Rhizobium leguminosarum]NKL58322.1 hypothetical protein [Rhizobium leguminosarum bv. viciae]
MAPIRSPFQKAVSNLKAPSAAAYVQADWDAAYKSATPTVEDTRLYEAAKWIAAEAEEGRKRFSSPAFGPLSAEWATILAVAALNREYRTAVNLRSEALKKRGAAEPFISMDAMAGVRISSDTGQHFTVEDLAESSTDLTENWLFDAMTATGMNPPPNELSVHAVEAGRAYSFRKSLNTLWNQARHEGWYFEQGPDGISRWNPGSRQDMILNQTWLQRQQSNLMNYPNIDSSVWPKLTVSQRRKRARTHGATSVKRSGNTVKVKVSSPSYLSAWPPHYAIEKSALEGSFLRDFLGTDMPKIAGVTVSMLLLAWHLVLDIAKELSKGVELPSLLSPERAEHLALSLPARVLKDALMQGIPASLEIASAIIDFLTFELKNGSNEKGNRGLWSAPLIKVPNRDDYLLPLPALETSNPARKVEAWLEKGGIDDANPVTTRGILYETLYRSRVKEEIDKNKKFNSASAAEHGIKPTKGFKEEIDLLVCFGGFCIVGEVKLFLMPTEPAERARYDGKLESAAKQAKRKAEALKAKPEVAAATLGISVQEASTLEYLPLVVTAQNYGFSTRVEDVLVVEAEFLKMYLSGSDIVVGRAIQFGSSRTVDQTRQYYANEAGAAGNFVKEASSPYVLTRISERFVWATSPFPTLAHAGATLAVPVFRDVSGNERRRAQSLIDLLSPTRA